MPASQDFRDGAATGAAMMAVRLRNVVSYGITPTWDVIDKIAEGIVYEYGGKVSLGTEPSGPAHDHLGRNCPPSCPAHGYTNGSGT